MDEIGIRGIPKNSKLLLLGDWYQRFGDRWRVVCYFYNKETGSFRKALPVDALPALIAGSAFPKTLRNTKVKEWTGTFRLPDRSRWERRCYRDLPKTLTRAEEFSDQFENCSIYQIQFDSKIYWIPASELARVLFFQSAEITRAAVYQGNILQLGKAFQEDRIGHVELSSNLPARYLNNLQFRKFFTWMFFTPEAERSFASIFSHMNRGICDLGDAKRWTFSFDPPNINGCEISYAGFTGMGQENSQILVREIRSISGIKSPELDIVYFSHPYDDALVQDQNATFEQSETNERRHNLGEITTEIDLESHPRASKNAHLLKLGAAGFNFDIDPELRRDSTRLYSAPSHSQDDEMLSEILSEPVSWNEGRDHGKGLRVDVENLDPPELISPPEKFAFFQTMLRTISENNDWKIETYLGDVPQMQCRSAHLVQGRARQYCHAILTRDDTTVVQLLEIELTDKTRKDGTKDFESLSTLFFRAADTTATYQCILDELMSRYKDDGINAMCWKRKFNSKVTVACEYLGHPDQKVKDLGEALTSWVTRAEAKVRYL